jgi:hypothetical protein
MRVPFRQMTVQGKDFFLQTTINMNLSGTRLCGLTSKAAPASEKLRRTQATESSPNLINPVSRTRLRGVLRASVLAFAVVGMGKEILVLKKVKPGPNP